MTKTRYIAVPEELFGTMRIALLGAEMYLADEEVGRRKGYDRLAKDRTYIAADAIRAYDKTGECIIPPEVEKLRARVDELLNANNKLVFQNRAVDTAMCVWEHVFTVGNGPAGKWEALFEWGGTAEVRDRARQAAPFVDQVFEAMDEEIRSNEPFDWEVVPAILSTFDGDLKPTMSVEETARAVEKLLEGK